MVRALILGPLAGLALAAVAARAPRALTPEELRADPGWTCALYLARGDLLAETVVGPLGRDPVAATTRLRAARDRGDPRASAALGWWRRAADAGCGSDG